MERRTYLPLNKAFLQYIDNSIRFSKIRAVVRSLQRDLILIDYENEELITEEHRILRSEPS